MFIELGKIFTNPEEMKYQGRGGKAHKAESNIG
jgi:hypothetical protein